MFKEKMLDNALQAYLAGQCVMVMIPDDEEFRLIPLEKFFNECHLLVDQKPTIINRELEKVFEVMEEE